MSAPTASGSLVHQIVEFFRPFEAAYALHVIINPHDGTEIDPSKDILHQGPFSERERAFDHLSLTLPRRDHDYAADSSGLLVHRPVFWAHDEHGGESIAQCVGRHGLAPAYDSQEFRSARAYTFIVVDKKNGKIVATKHYNAGRCEDEGTWIDAQHRIAYVCRVVDHQKRHATTLNMVVQRIYCAVAAQHPLRAEYVAYNHHPEGSDDGTEFGRKVPFFQRNYCQRHGYVFHEAGRVPNTGPGGGFHPAQTHPAGYYMHGDTVNSAEHHEDLMKSCYGYLQRDGRIGIAAPGHHA